MDWTVVDTMYARFPTLKLKCEHVLEAEISSLQDARFLLDGQVNQGSEVYQAWCLEPSEVSKVILWEKWEDFYKPQGNELRARYDLFKSFIKAGSCVDEWYNRFWSS